MSWLENMTTTNQQYSENIFENPSASLTSSSSELNIQNTYFHGNREPSFTHGYIWNNFSNPCNISTSVNALSELNLSSFCATNIQHSNTNRNCRIYRYRKIITLYIRRIVIINENFSLIVHLLQDIIKKLKIFELLMNTKKIHCYFNFFLEQYLIQLSNLIF